MKKSQQKAKKVTRTDAGELRRIRLAIGYDQASMAVALDLSINTYQCYEYGQRPLPDDLLDKASAEQKRDRQVMKSIKQQIERTIDQTYPGLPPASNES